MRVNSADSRPNRLSHCAKAMVKMPPSINQAYHNARHENKSLSVLHPAKVMVVKFSKGSTKNVVCVNNHHKNKKYASKSIYYSEAQYFISKLEFINLMIVFNKTLVYVCF